ncbi:MAG: transketolase C-terminal domain-containing protein [Streptococcus sp.]|nr:MULTISPECIES: transketolase C-terminal domain-containing protein [Streptococcus]MDU6443808.1 transketolase C-terminal domain-containing protein [Streptococcus sp.]MDU6638150.1 transketolase C-terminal domain-containing protein [Streptococcus sp.]MDU7845853.1 transketolase C-terminal domain-containing protein [Streptococcus sp.]WOO58974.1 transketolase C-terminal domain-containing protein [Streptococcus pasteurianus]
MMSNKIANRAVMCDVLIEAAKDNKDLLVLTSDSRGSASLVDFAKAYPEQIVETGIAEQNLVGISAGLALNGKRPFVASPACFLSMRSIEQVKVDVAYSNKNVKLVGISGGVSYGALGASHHSLQDIAVTRAIPNLEVIIPADRHETKAVFEYLVKSDKPAYIRLGRNPVEDCFTEENISFEIGKARMMVEGTDVTIAAVGETVRVAMDAAEVLKKEGISTRVLNFASLKPFDDEAVRKAVAETKGIVSVEEHSVNGGLGSAIAAVVAEEGGRLTIMGIPDETVVTGTTKEVFDHYGISVSGISEKVKELLANVK